MSHGEAAWEEREAQSIHMNLRKAVTGRKWNYTS